MLSERSLHKERAVGCVIVTKEVLRLEQLETMTRAGQSAAPPHTMREASDIDPVFDENFA